MYVIGLDVGTTCTKALLVDDKGKVVANHSSSYALISKGSHIEQDAEDWIKASVITISNVAEKVNKRDIRGISLSTQGSSTVALDAEGNFIGNAVTWMDTRAEKEAAEISEKLGEDYIYYTSGWKINPALDAAKIYCLKKDPQYSKAVLWLSTLEVMNLFLTGKAVIDPTNAASRQLYNVEQGCWDSKILEAAHIQTEELAEICPTGECVGELREEAAIQMGLLPGIPVFNGAHDQYCASIGAGAVNEGDMLLSAGTTWILLGIGKKPLFTKSCISSGKHPVQGLYGAMASLVCSGAALEWYKNGFLQENFDKMNEIVSTRREKAKDLFFYPYLTGANYPIWNLKVRGAFTGLALEHDRFDLARAIMEGVAFGVKRGLDDYASNGYDVKQLIIMGGASKSPCWCQMIASIIAKPVLKMNQSDVCAIGAAMIAACGLGIFKNYEKAAKHMSNVEEVFWPEQEEVDFYNEKYKKYIAMWNAIQEYYK